MKVKAVGLLTAFFVRTYMQFIPVEELSAKNRAALTQFLMKHERLCVQLSASARKSMAALFAVYVNDVCAADLYGLVSIKKTILHCLPFANHEEKTAMQDDFVRSFADFFKGEGFACPVCVNGTESGSALVLDALRACGYEPAEQNAYFLMTLPRNAPCGKNAALPAGAQIVRCKKDLPEPFRRQLFDLQKHYETEEVVPVCLSLDEDLCRLRLSNSLRTQYILALCLSDPATGAEQLVAKAGTNAIGFKAVQFGGVYTSAPFRKRGFARILLCALISKILRMRRVPVLFVKTHNATAVSLYHSLGFMTLCGYTIAYYGG